MPRDYAKKNRSKKTASRRNTRSSKQQKPAPWVWMIAGLCIGLFISSLIYLKEHHLIESIKTNKHSSRKTSIHSPPKPGQNPVINNSQQQPSKPRFDFYTILPKMKVWVPSSIERSSIERTNQPSKQRTTPVRYFLQVASVKRYQDADKLKAQLLLMGYNVNINRVKTAKITWHQLWIGPYKTKEIARQIQKKLAQEHKQSIIITVKT